MYIFAVALEDGSWHHVDSYIPERAHRPDTVRLWRRIETVEDPEWTARHHEQDPTMRAFGGRAEVRLGDSTTVTDEFAVANAHPQGARPFTRRDYLRKFARRSPPGWSARPSIRASSTWSGPARAVGGGPDRADRHSR